MEEFKSLQSIWTQQESEIKISSEEVIQESDRLQKKLIHKKRGTVVILSVTVFILVAFMFYVTAYKFIQPFIGIGLMIASLVLRILVELVSIQRFQKIKEIISFRECSKKLLLFYNWRKKVSYVFVPIIFILYVIGFVLLLPSFKENLSSGFYNYVLFSGIAILLFFVFFIRQQILNELRITRELANMFTSEEV